MFRYLFPVQIYLASVAYGSEIKELPLSGLRVSIEMSGVPYGPFIIFQFGSLRIPVTGNIETQPAFERVLVELLPGLRCPVLVHLHFLALVVQVDYCIPFPVQELIVPSIYIRHERSSGIFRR